MWTRFGRIVIGVFGVLILSAGLVGAYIWFYKLAPVRRTLDSRWIDSHSHEEYWREVQEGIRRGTWNHDDGSAVGWYGDKSWAEWIMARVQPGDRMRCGSRFHHSETSMQFLTNQDAGDNADGWLAWWEKNRGKSQRQWMMEGFQQHGAQVDFPPTAEQRETLLALLGRPEISKAPGDPAPVPNYVKYNAFRWLRDSGFEPVEYAVSGKELSAGAKAGVLEYASHSERFPRAQNVGILPFSPAGEEAPYDARLPVMLLPRIQFLVQAMIWIPLALGLCLLTWSLLAGNKERESDG